MAHTTFTITSPLYDEVSTDAYKRKLLDAAPPGSKISAIRVTPKIAVRVERDYDPSNPRDNDNLGVMYCEHNRYSLGDKNAEDPRVDMCIKCKSKADCCYCEDPQIEQIMDPDVFAYLWLYLYDHSGITISASRGGNPFHCPWDSGCVGIIYMPRKVAEENWPSLKDDEDALRAAAEKCLQAEVEEYDDYLTGNYWGYVIENEEGMMEDSCWGFHGDKLEDTGMLDHVDEKYHELLKAAWDNRT